MGDVNAFVVSLQNFPKENITDEDCELLETYTESALFTVEMTAKVSQGIQPVTTVDVGLVHESPSSSICL